MIIETIEKVGWYLEQTPQGLLWVVELKVTRQKI
jgi:hypothetical protein